ncbi:hypothetical protein [Nitrobacter vulgaris]|uniref:Uncharacterized protein n=1 Tax=Nitrobacter vulgaris TaxID=29421 RepID=A0A1V4HWM6_NITVU|nr:hypothetical protein [Nitrobacter vulgaris]OPH82378.1 hypothetical protein B2M20_12375 [Nitrobacter vulgaris]
MPVQRERLNPIKRERLHDNKEPIKRERLHAEPENISDFAPTRRKLRPTRKSRGPNKERLITDNRRLLLRRELADVCAVSVDTVKKWEAKNPGDTGIKPVRLTPNGRSVFYDIEDAERYLGIALRPKQAVIASTDAPDETPPPSEQPPNKSS